jgi:hypothetical protein
MTHSSFVAAPALPLGLVPPPISPLPPVPAEPGEVPPELVLPPLADRPPVVGPESSSSFDDAASLPLGGADSFPELAPSLVAFSSLEVNCWPLHAAATEDIITSQAQT